MAVRHLELHRLVCEAAICPALHRNLTLIHDRGLQQTQHSAPIRQSGKLCLSQLQNAFTAGACLRPHFQRIRQLFTFSALNPHGKAAVGAALPPRKSILNIVPGNALYCHGHSSPVHRRRKLGGFFYGPGWGEGHKKLNCSLIVTDLPDYGRFVAEHRPPNVFVAQTTPMDENGKFQISLCMMWEPETFAAVMAQPDHRIILEVNPQQVHVKGGLEIDINDVSCLYEVDEPLAEIPAMQATEVEDTIGGLVSELVHDGDTIQLGIGSLPDAVARHLMDKHDLGLHTEMFTSSMGEMIRRGVITGERKNYYKGVHVGSFAGGDRALYETMQNTPTLRIVPGSYGVNPMTIMIWSMVWPMMAL